MLHKVIEATRGNGGKVDLGEWGFVTKDGFYDKDKKTFKMWHLMDTKEQSMVYQIMSNLGMFTAEVNKYICNKCEFKARPSTFHYGRGREYGEHPEHRYCPVCGGSIDWYGYRTVKELPSLCDNCQGFNWRQNECMGGCPYQMPQHQGGIKNEVQPK